MDFKTEGTGKHSITHLMMPGIFTGLVLCCLLHLLMLSASSTMVQTAQTVTAISAFAI